VGDLLGGSSLLYCLFPYRTPSVSFLYGDGHVAVAAGTRWAAGRPLLPGYIRPCDARRTTCLVAYPYVRWLLFMTVPLRGWTLALPLQHWENTGKNTSTSACGSLNMFILGRLCHLRFRGRVENAVLYPFVENMPPGCCLRRNEYMRFGAHMVTASLSIPTPTDWKNLLLCLLAHFMA